MEIRNLMTFIHVAETNSFTKTAKRLGYSQSTISFQIKALEEELGCLLFERINHTITLTSKGKELLEYAQKVTRLTEEFKQDFGDLDVKGHIRIVTPDSICESMMIHNYVKFYQRYPSITLKFSTADTDDMFRILNQNEADIIFTLDSHVYHNDYIIAKEEPVKTHFVTNSSSPLKDKEVTIFDIIHYPFILTEKGMGYRRVLDEKLATLSLEINPVLEISRTDLITRLLETSDSIGFLPDFVTKQKVQEGKLIYLNVKDFDVDIWKQLIYHKNKWLSKPLTEFIDFVKENEFNDCTSK